MNNLEPDQKSGSSSTTSTQEMLSEPKQLRTRYRWWIMIWSLVMVGAVIGAEFAATNFLTSFLHKQGFPKTTAITINTCGLASNTVGRILAILILTRLPPRILIVILTALYTLSPIAMLFTVSYPQIQYPTIICGAVMNLGFSANYAAIVSYVNGHIPITATYSSLLYATIGLVNACDPFIIGSLFDFWPRICLIVIISHGLLNMLGFVMIEMSYTMFARYPNTYYITNNT